MLNLYRRKQFSEDCDTIDALAALQVLEEQEQGQELEFFRITGEMQQLGCNEGDIEKVLPELLKTKREKALYDALMTVAKTSRHAAGFPVRAHEHRKIAHEFRKHC